MGTARAAAMSTFEFAEIVNSADVEAATHRVFGRAYMKWITQGPEALTEGEVTVYCVETTFGEVCNGGIEQYLTNESGALAEHCPAAFRRVGLPKYADIIEEAISLCVKDYVELEKDPDDPRSPHFMWELKDETGSDPFEDLDKRFFKLYFADKDEFRVNLFKYIATHESEFVGSDL
jgi:hypothetical protein